MLIKNGLKMKIEKVSFFKKLGTLKYSYQSPDISKQKEYNVTKA